MLSNNYLANSHTKTLTLLLNVSIMCRPTLKDRYNDHYLNKHNINDKLNYLKYATLALSIL